MKPILATTSLAGGAGGATARLLTGLRARGQDARVVVEDRFVPSFVDAAAVTRVAPSFLQEWSREERDRRPLRRYTHRRTNHFSLQRARSRAQRAVRALDPDVVNLHWVCGGFLSIEAVGKLGAPLVLTLHDQWSFTGGCHYSGDCTRYRAQCGACPVLGSDAEDDLSRAVWRRKRAAWSDLQPVVVAPSRWLADAARSSSLFAACRVEHIPYGVDADALGPPSADQRAAARRTLDVPPEACVVAFGAWDTRDPRKGLDVLHDALERLGDAPVVALSFGAAEPRQPPGAVPLVEVGHLEPPALARLLSAADVFALPSRQDNLPTTLLEAMASGLACVGFEVGGVPDLLEDGRTGLLVPQVGDAEALAAALRRLVRDRALRERLGAGARARIERAHRVEHEAGRYADLFAELAERRR